MTPLLYRRLRPLTATLALTALGAGCTSLLGDFTVGNGAATNDGGGGSEGGSADGASLDGSGTGDASSDTQPPSDAPDAADFYLNCDGFKFAKHVLVESLDNQSGQNRSYGSGNAPAVVTISDNVVHIVSRSPGTAGSFTFFTIDKNNPNFSGPYHQPLGENLNDVKPLRSGTGIMTTHYQSFQTFLGVVAVPPNQAPGATLPPQIPLEQLPANGTSRFSSTFAELQPFDYFYAYTNQLSNDAGANLFVGRTLPDGGVNRSQLDNNTIGGGSPILLRAGSFMYVYISSDPSSGGTRAYKVPDNGLSPSVTPRRLSSGGAAIPLMIAAGASPKPNQYDIAIVEFDPNSTTALATLRVGAVDGAKLDSFQPADLPKGPVINDTSELPIDKGVGAWFGDEFTMIGKGSPSTHPGMNFLWMDAQGHVRTRKTGTSALLANEPHPVNSAGIALASRIGSRYVTFNLVWTETLNDPDAGGDYDAMFLNELICH